MHAETVAESGKLYLASCGWGTTWIQTYDPSTNAISPGVPVSGLSCDSIDNIIGNIGVARVGTLEDGDYIRVSWPHLVGANHLALEIQAIKATGPSSNPTYTPIGSNIEVRSSYATGTIPQMQAIQTDRNEIGLGSRLNDTLYYWHDANGPSPGYGTSESIRAMLVRDTASFMPMQTLRTLSSPFIKDGDYEGGASFYDLASHKLSFVPIWTESPGTNGHTLAASSVTIGPEEVFANFLDRGGVYTSSPAMSSWGDGRLDLFGVGTDGYLYHTVYDQSFGWWTGYDRFAPPPGLTLLSGPAAVSWSWGTNRYRRLGERPRDLAHGV
jgi:hypothetical protein